MSETIQDVVNLGINLPFSIQDLFAPYIIGQESADSDSENEQNSFDDGGYIHYKNLSQDVKIQI